jgi:hypothetical protein
MAKGAARRGSRSSHFSNHINPRKSKLASAPDHGKGPAKDKRTLIAMMVAAMKRSGPAIQRTAPKVIPVGIVNSRAAARTVYSPSINGESRPDRTVRPKCINMRMHV